MVRIFIALIVLLSATIAGCQGSTTPPVEYTQYELEYRLMANFGDVFYCDPDVYPVSREGQEEQNALEQFAAIRNNEAEFSAILQQIGLTEKADYTTEEKILVYREHKKLTLAIQMTAAGDKYNFTLRVGEVEGESIEGTITRSGQIKVTKRVASFNTCPICLAAGTLIDTPGGAVPVEQLTEGMSVWTVDEDGERVEGVVMETASMPVPASFEMVRITLSDGRVVTASAGHPAAGGRALGDYQAGDSLDEGTVLSIERVTYSGGFTYDFLPSGATGLYWANGILLRSTLWNE